MVYCGLDLSLSGTGIVVLNDKNEVIVSSLVSTLPKNSIEKRIDTIYRYFGKVINIYTRRSILINIEGLAYGLRGQRSLELAGLHYYFRVKLLKKKISFIITPPTTLKKFVTGKGNAKKNLILLSVYKRWNETFQDDNLADSYSLARYLNTDNK